jgi:MFS family permease
VLLQISGLRRAVAQLLACLSPASFSGLYSAQLSVDSELKSTKSQPANLIVKHLYFHSIIESHLSWRWMFWVMMIFAGVCTVIMLFTLPETYAPVLLLSKVRTRGATRP